MLTLRDQKGNMGVARDVWGESSIVHPAFDNHEGLCCVGE